MSKSIKTFPFISGNFISCDGGFSEKEGSSNIMEYEILSIKKEENAGQRPQI